MSYLIDREQIIQKLKNRRNLFCPNHFSFSVLQKDDKARVDEIDNCIADIKNLLPAGLVKTGKWVRRKGANCWECSQCHAVLEDFDIKLHNFYFCYHCGANMKTMDGWMNIEKVKHD